MAGEGLAGRLAALTGQPAQRAQGSPTNHCCCRCPLLMHPPSPQLFLARQEAVHQTDRFGFPRQSRESQGNGEKEEKHGTKHTKDVAGSLAAVVHARIVQCTSRQEVQSPSIATSSSTPSKSQAAAAAAAAATASPTKKKKRPSMDEQRRLRTVSTDGASIQLCRIGPHLPPRGTDRPLCEHDSIAPERQRRADRLAMIQNRASGT